MDYLKVSAWFGVFCASILIWMAIFDGIRALLTFFTSS